MGRKGFRYGIPLAMEKIDINMQSFWYYYTTGRIAKSYKITIIITNKQGNMEDAFNILRGYSKSGYDISMVTSSIKELQEKGWINKKQLTAANKIKKILSKEKLAYRSIEEPIKIIETTEEIY